MPIADEKSEAVFYLWMLTVKVGDCHAIRLWRHILGLPLNSGRWDWRGPFVVYLIPVRKGVPILWSNWIKN